MAGSLIVSGETDTSEGNLILTNSGDAVIDIDNENSIDETYFLKIENLSENSVDIEVSLMIGAAVLLYIATSYVIVKSGVVYCIADAFTKAVSKAETAVRKKSRNYYYPAILKTINKRTYVYVNPKGINVNRAAALVKGGASIYSYTSAMARKVLTTAGYIPCSSKGVKNQSERHSSAGYQFCHYHAGHTNSKGVLAKTGSIHSLYGTAKYYN